MLKKTFKSGTRLGMTLTLTGLAGCASDGGLGDAAALGAMFLPMPGSVDTGLVTTAVGVAAGAYVVSSVATADSPSVSPATSVVAAPPGMPPIDLQKLVTREVPDRYRGKSCEYIEIALGEVPMYEASAEPVMQQVGAARKTAAGQVWMEKKCRPANWPGGKIGISMDTIDPQRAMALSLPTAGVVVISTVAGSGAQQAGILPSDAIVAVDDQPIGDSIDFKVKITKAAIGSKVNLKVWRGNAFSSVPVVVGPAGTQVSVTPTAPAAGDLYCISTLTTEHTYGAILSPVKLIAGAAYDLRPSMNSYIAKVKQLQPGVWGDFKLSSDVCAPAAPVCVAVTEGPTGKEQNAFQICHTTQAQADAELLQMHQGDPQAVTVDWP
jgi:hypothetical protein